MNVLEAIGSRRRMAAQAAADAASLLAEGGSRSLDLQAQLEEALSDLEHYANSYDRVKPLADEIGDYRRDGGRSIVADLYAARSGDRPASKRIVSHARATNAGALHEQRDIGGGNLWATVPTWLVDDAAPTSIAVAPILHMVGKPLPPGVHGTVNLVRWTTAPTASAQNGMNGSLPTPSIADGTVGPAVRTYGTRAKLSLQLIEQGREGIDAQLIPSMIAAVDEAIETDIVSADGTAGTVTGIFNTSSISTATYIDTTPTLLECWPNVEGAVRAVEIGRGGSPIVVMHPRRLSWMRQRAVTEGAAVFDFDTPTLPGASVRVLGSVNIVTDPTIPTNRGTGTNEDAVIVFRSSDVLDCFVSAPRVQIGDIDGAEVYVNVFRQVVFTAGRLPAAVAVVSGSGLAAP